MGGVEPGWLAEVKLKAAQPETVRLPGGSLVIKQVERSGLREACSYNNGKGDKWIHWVHAIPQTGEN